LEWEQWLLDKHTHDVNKVKLMACRNPRRMPSSSFSEQRDERDTNK